MTSDRFAVNISPEVLKLKDPKVDMLVSSRIPAEMFALMIQPTDPYVLIDDTVYALTEQEFYALRGIYAITGFSDKMFLHVVNLEDLSFMSQDDRAFILGVRDGLATCSACQYRKNREAVEALVKKYGIEMPDDIRDKPMEIPGDYPETTGKVIPMVFALLDHMYALPKKERRSCMDCVEKHISQAYVLAKECLQGYPEHIAYVVGHLGEAIDELPKELYALRSTLEFCLAKTNYTRRPFVPLGALVAHLDAGRNPVEGDEDDVPVDETRFELELTDAMRSELSAIPADMRFALARRCRGIDEQFTLGVRNLSKNIWLGDMACMADKLADIAPLTANMIRARRLVFGAAPDLMVESGYGMTDIADLVNPRAQA